MTAISFPREGELEPLVVTWFRFGDVVESPGPNGRFESWFVLHNCGHATSAFFCATCRLYLANRGNLEIHLERGGAHRLAVWCPTDRLYEEPTLELRAAFDSSQGELL